MKTKSLLINYNSVPYIISSLMPDNGLASLAGVLTANGHETKILDYVTVSTFKRLFPYPFFNDLKSVTGRILSDISRGTRPREDDILEFQTLDQKIDEFQRKKSVEIASDISQEIELFHPDFLGFKLWIGEGFHGSVLMAEKIKKQYPEIKIFGGGPQVDWFNETIFKFTNVFDALARGEGEETILLLADYVLGNKNLGDIPNIITKQNGDIIRTPTKRIDDLNNFAMPAYDNLIYPALVGDEKVKIFFVEEIRGCPQKCNFCIHPLKSGSKWRPKTASRVVNEIENVLEMCDTDYIRFSGSNPSPNIKRDVAREILIRDLDVKYTSFAHPKIIRTEDYKLIKESGGYILFFGVESGNLSILQKGINKGTTPDLIRKALKAARDAGIRSVASFIFPAPYETEETRRETLDLITETRPDSIVVSPPAIVLGTEWGNNSTQYGFKILKPETFDIDMLTYKAKYSVPPVLWQPLPYNLGGKTFSEYSAECNNFIMDVESKGILTQMTDDMILMAMKAGIEPKEFRNTTRTLFSLGDYQGISDLVKKINKGTE